MKKLNFRGKNIVFESPDEILFSSKFQSKLYKFFYSKLPLSGDYKFFFDTDFIASEESEINLLDEFKMSEIKNKKLPGGKGLSEEDLKRYKNQQLIREYLFEDFPAFVALFKNNIVLQNHAIENAKVLLGIEKIDIGNFMDIKALINKIYKDSWSRNKSMSENQSANPTVGKISENLIEAAFSGMVDHKTFFNSKGNDSVKSYGDFVMLCLPNNLWISVKSGYARERLLASGYSNDILGAGFFIDHTEFTSESKIRNLKKVGFLAIYCPDIPVSEEQIEEGVNTYDLIKDALTKYNKSMPVNINSKPFIRRLSKIKDDLEEMINEKDIGKRSTIGF